MTHQLEKWQKTECELLSFATPTAFPPGATAAPVLSSSVLVPRHGASSRAYLPHLDGASQRPRERALLRPHVQQTAPQNLGLLLASLSHVQC